MEEGEKRRRMSLGRHKNEERMPPERKKREKEKKEREKEWENRRKT